MRGKSEPRLVKPKKIQLRDGTADLVEPTKTGPNSGARLSLRRHGNILHMRLTDRV